MNTRVRNQVCLELVQVDIQRAVEAEGRGDGRHDLSDQAVQVLERRARDIQVAAADIVDGFVVDEEGAVGVLDGGVGGENGIVGLDDGGGDARGGVDGELELGFLAVVRGEALQEEGAEAGAGSAAEGVEDEEALEGRAVVLCIHQRGLFIHQTNKQTNKT